MGSGPGLDPHKVFSFLKWVWFLFNLFVFALSIVGCWGNRSLRALTRTWPVGLPNFDIDEHLYLQLTKTKLNIHLK